MEKEEIKQLTCTKISQWRNWLERNHLKEDKVLLIRYKKHTGKGMFNQRDAMNEAICFGWIDTTLKRIDDDMYGVTFVKRKKSSRWSENTFARAREMIAQGKMSAFGKEMFELGLTKKTHDHGIPKNPDMPEDLKAELEKAKNKKARENFEKLPPSQKRMYFRWLLGAKRTETRIKRVGIIINNMETGKRLGVNQSANL
ncbi:hypothetical protein COU60_04285 [Candidatus Pacearchaeota archaeon CG10_big_fil_rev_8_21_14_0_10_34_76]|nr:MAG: hypothetical protein COU60_04285 [Candidatus Pacearchaeota archaeon CG10_big_fil_rev_8_21_14_0_10_34_76]